MYPIDTAIFYLFYFFTVPSLATIFLIKVITLGFYFYIFLKIVEITDGCLLNIA